MAPRSSRLILASVKSRTIRHNRDRAGLTRIFVLPLCIPELGGDPASVGPIRRGRGSRRPAHPGPGTLHPVVGQIKMGSPDRLRLMSGEVKRSDAERQSHRALPRLYRPIKSPLNAPDWIAESLPPLFAVMSGSLSPSITEFGSCGCALSDRAEPHLPRSTLVGPLAPQKSSEASLRAQSPKCWATFGVFRPGQHHGHRWCEHAGQR